MLTWGELVALCEAGRLAQWKTSKRATQPGERVLYMLPEVLEQIQGEWPLADEDKNPQRTRERRAAMRSVLNRYVIGETLNYRNDIKELGSDPGYEAMRGYWEFRSQGPQTETRLFGFFARPGVFVATEFRSRQDFVDSPEEWERSRQRSLLLWNSLTNDASYLNEPWPVQIRDHLMEYINDPNCARDPTS